jgi:hypothetical protein
MAASTELVIPHRSSTGTVHLTPVSWIKVTILSDDSNENSSVVAPPIKSLLVSSTHPNSIERTPTPISYPPFHVGHHQSLNVVDSLKGLRASKGARNAFRSLNYDSLHIQRV